MRNTSRCCLAASQKGWDHLVGMGIGLIRSSSDRLSIAFIDADVDLLVYPWLLLLSRLTGYLVAHHVEVAVHEGPAAAVLDDEPRAGHLGGARLAL